MILFKRVLFIIFIISGTFLPCAFFTHVMTVQEKIGQGTEVSDVRARDGKLLIIFRNMAG